MVPFLPLPQYAHWTLAHGSSPVLPPLLPRNVKMCGPQKRYHPIHMNPLLQEAPLAKFWLLTVKLQGPLTATKSDGFTKNLFASACRRHESIFSIFIHFPCRAMPLHLIILKSMCLCSNPCQSCCRVSKLSVSSITGSSAVATNVSFTPQLEDSSGLTPWRPQVEASHPAAYPGW